MKNKETKPEIKALFKKAKELKEGEFLHTTFGPDNYYLIYPKENEFVLEEYRNKWSFQKKKNGSLLKSVSFNSEESLSAEIFFHHEFYSYNHFKCKYIHFDNWVNFVKGFKPVVLREYNQKK